MEYTKQIIALVAIIVLLILSARLMKKIQDKPIAPPEEEFAENMENQDITEEENKNDVV